MVRSGDRDRVVYSLAGYGRWGFLIVITVLITLIIIDISVIRIYDYISKFYITTFHKEILFVIISLACLTAESILIEFMRPFRTDQERKSKLHLKIIYWVTKLAQYALGALIIFLIQQILFGSSYNTINLVAIISCSYLLSVSILGVFIARILGLLSFRRNLIVLILFVLTIGSVTANILITLVNVSLRLLERPSETRVFLAGSLDISKGRFDILDNLYFVSYLISFVTAWIATVALLSYYSRKIGKVKYWLVTAGPMVFFLSQYVVLNEGALLPFISLSPYFVATVVIVVAITSKPIAGLMLGIGFWTTATKVEKKSLVRGYLIFAGSGFLMLFTSNQAMLMSVAPYPPFGVATVTAIGISAYLVVVGLYATTISLSQDTELRRSIRQLAGSQSVLFDSMVSGEASKEIENRVMEIVKKHSLEMEDQSGIETSLDEVEVQRYLKEVIDEVQRGKN